MKLPLRLIVLALAAVIVLPSCGRSEKTASSAPKGPDRVLIPGEILGMESNAMTVYGPGTANAVVALGQVFRPPAGHPVLSSVGFLILHPREQPMNVKLVVSSWLGKSPAPESLWESAITPITPHREHRFDWLRFDVPALALAPGKPYLAWLTTSGVDNPRQESFGVVRMGRRHAPDGRSTASLYPDGAMVTYWQLRAESPRADRAGDPWRVESPLVNAHFQMEFDRR